MFTKKKYVIILLLLYLIPLSAQKESLITEKCKITIESETPGQYLINSVPGRVIITQKQCHFEFNGAAKIKTSAMPISVEKLSYNITQISDMEIINNGKMLQFKKYNSEKSLLIFRIETSNAEKLLNKIKEIQNSKK
ncbi:MAG: hypothetical protein C0412_09065 [Flavobacterium sp.]|nr:hypothetical protein [Flavobacterium sp.]